MITSDRFLRFAAECEVMAKFTRSRENRMIWNGMAERLLRCAELMGRQDANARRGNLDFTHIGSHMDGDETPKLIP
jgi:hypothetical protein